MFYCASIYIFTAMCYFFLASLQLNLHKTVNMRTGTSRRTIQSGLQTHWDSSVQRGSNILEHVCVNNLLKFCFLDIIFPQGAIRHVTLAVGRGLCPALPVLPTAFICLRVFAHPNVPSVTTTTATETVSVSVRTFGYSHSLPLKQTKKKKRLNLRWAL